MIVIIAGIHISQEIFEIDVLTALKSYLEHRRKHVLRLLRRYGDQALVVKIASMGLRTCFLSFPAVAWSLYGSNDHRH